MGIYAKKVDSCWFTWNGDNRKTKASLVKNAATLRTLTFKYDPFGRRVEKKVVNNVAANTTTWSYLYDGDDIVQIKESDATSTHTTHLTHGPGIDEPLAMVRGGVAYLYHADGLGSIVAISNDQGNIVNRYSYESFGMMTATDPTFPNAYTYTGREWDKEFGLYYYRARYYDPLEGRFISKDPIGFAGGDVNLYGYVMNIPTNWIDPYGTDMFRHGGEPYYVGREGLPIFSPQSLPMNLLENYVPYFHDFGKHHDDTANWCSSNGVPDLLCNVPTMPVVYALSVLDNGLQCIGAEDILFPGIQNAIEGNVENGTSDIFRYDF